MENKYVVGLGEILWDLLPEGKKMGGAPANFAYHVSQMRLQSIIVSAVGDDELGHEILRLLDERHLTYHIDKPSHPTGVVHVQLDANGVPSYNIQEGVAWDYIGFTPEVEAIAKQTKAVCFGSLGQRSEVSRATIQAFLEAMPKEDDVFRVFDINLRQHYYSKELIETSLRLCDVLKINDEELRIVAPLFDHPFTGLEEAAQYFLDAYRLRMVILTCGTGGSYVFTPTETSFFETPKVEVVDTVGAGDSFTAAFIASILRGDSVRVAHSLAVDVSAYVCTQAGAMPVLPASLCNK